MIAARLAFWFGVVPFSGGAMLAGIYILATAR